MARRRKKQKSADRQGQIRPQAPVQPESGLEHGKISEITLRKKEPQQSQEKTGNAAPQTVRGAKRQVAVSTCVAGMFLTLVLGLYLGTLMPGVVNDLRPGVPKQQAAAPVPPISAQPDQELAHMIAELEKKAAANPDSAPDWINLGNIYFDAMRPTQAVAAYEHALTLAPRNADVLTDLGIMYRETGQFDKAITSFQKAIDINPRHENALFNQGVVLATDLGKNAEAAAVWQKLLDINPQARAPDGQSLKDMLTRLK